MYLKYTNPYNKYSNILQGHEDSLFARLQIVLRVVIVHRFLLNLNNKGQIFQLAHDLIVICVDRHIFIEACIIQVFMVHNIIDNLDTVPMTITYFINLITIFDFLIGLM